MKRQILSLTIISALGYGILHFSSETNLVPESVENNIEHFPKAARLNPAQKDHSPPSGAETTTEVLSLDDLESHFQDMETEELQKEQIKLEHSKTKESLLVRANSGKLSSQDELELKTYLRSQAVISKILMDRKFEDLEAL